MWAGSPYAHIMMAVEYESAMAVEAPPALPATGRDAVPWLAVALAPTRP